MTKRKLTFTILALSLLTIPFIAIAQGHHGGRGEGAGDGPGGFFGHDRGHGGFGPGMLLGRLADKLELSDEQRTEIEAIYEASREATSELRDQRDAAREQYRETHEIGVFDETQARQFAETVTGIQAELMVAHMRANAEAFNVLTPEQQDELKDLLEQFGDFFGPHRKGRHGMGRS